MNFFQYYKQMDYQFAEADTPSVTYSLAMTDITLRAQIAERLQQYTSAYYDYVITDGERPDSTATRVYGDPRYTWIVLLLNNIVSPYDWPLSTDEFNAYMTGKYGTLERAQATTTAHEYYFDASGNSKTYAEYCNLDPLEKGKVLPARYTYAASGERIDTRTYDSLDTSLRGVTLTPYAYELELNERRRQIRIILPEFLGPVTREIRTLFLTQ